MTGHEIRQKFLDYFAAHSHRVLRSSSLVPANDPTLLFTNAGMNQFKDVFLGMETRDYKRACSSQKCVRAGGKHNDLDNVGHTRRHHTFFEMLGNFSFGDYFKSEAIEFAWDLVTRGYGLEKDRLYITVFREDDEADELWRKVAGVPKDRIFRLDEKDNFWQMGETGPCGPCSEIHYDLGAGTAQPGHEHAQFPSDAGGRFVEIWNLVFMQFDRASSGVLTRLPRPSIDTGMGLERLAAILQGKLSNFDCDLLRPIIETAAGLFGGAYGDDPRTDVALRIAADHARAAAFLIHDGVLPSNDGRGYVLRKIMRRALRHARMSRVEEPFLHKLTGFVAELMAPAYPELTESVTRVARVVKDEEHRYATTFLVAEKVFLEEVTSAKGGALSGASSFKLYDTYGLALDEQEDMAREHSFAIDRAGFELEMEKQRERARASWKGGEKGQTAPVYQQLVARGRTRFLGYDKLEHSGGRVVGLIVDKTAADQIPAGARAEVVLDQTPFYAESGGQVGDCGALLHPETGEKIAEVESTRTAAPGLSAHVVTALAPIRVNDRVTARVDESARRATMRNHTATHLLHASLRGVLGPHVKQAGSVVDPQRLRFDFTHYTALHPDELAEIERQMNQQVLQNRVVATEVLDLDQALATGAMALFGEKYGDRVRVVSIPDFSKELCGGTHVERTGDIGLCKIIYEGGISAGVRRVEALSGAAALERFQQASASLERVASIFRTNEAELAEHVEKLIAQQKALEKENQLLRNKDAQSQANVPEVPHSQNFKAYFKIFQGLDRVQLRTIADSVRAKSPQETVIVLATSNGDLLTAVTKDLAAHHRAGDLLKKIASVVGGKGGGRPDLAEGAGADSSRLNEQVITRSIDEWWTQSS